MEVIALVAVMIVSIGLGVAASAAILWGVLFLMMRGVKRNPSADLTLSNVAPENPLQLARPAA